MLRTERKGSGMSVVFVLMLLLVWPHRRHNLKRFDAPCRRRDVELRHGGPLSIEDQFAGMRAQRGRVVFFFEFPL